MSTRHLTTVVGNWATGGTELPARRRTAALGLGEPSRGLGEVRRTRSGSRNGVPRPLKGRGYLSINVNKNLLRRPRALFGPERWGSAMNLTLRGPKSLSRVRGSVRNARRLAAREHVGPPQRSRDRGYLSSYRPLYFVPVPFRPNSGVGCFDRTNWGSYPGARLTRARPYYVGPFGRGTHSTRLLGPLSG